MFFTCVDSGIVMSNLSSIDRSELPCADDGEDVVSVPIDCLSLSDNLLLTFRNFEDAATSLGSISFHRLKLIELLKIINNIKILKLSLV